MAFFSHRVIMVPLFLFTGHNSKVASKQKQFKGTINGVDKATLRWFHEMRAENVPISGPMIFEKELKFTSLLGNNNFRASNRLISSFCECHRIFLKKSELHPENNNKNREKMFCPDDMYNADSTGLFYQLMTDCLQRRKL